MKPPTTNTLPFASNVAVGPERAVPSEPVALQVDSCASTIVALASRHPKSVVPNSDTKRNHARVDNVTKERECGFIFVPPCIMGGNGRGAKYASLHPASGKTSDGDRLYCSPARTTPLCRPDSTPQCRTIS